MFLWLLRLRFLTSTLTYLSNPTQGGNCAAPSGEPMEIIKLIDLFHEQTDDPKRAHLGCSQLGEECARRLFYEFRWAATEQISGRIRRLFRRGLLEEDVVLDDLKAIGFEVYEQQTTVSFPQNGHIGGSVDALLRHGDEHYLLEIKTHSAKSFAALKKGGMRTANFKHWVQMQAYMLGLELRRGIYFAVCKDTDELHVEELEIDREEAQLFVDRGSDIALSRFAPPRISDNPTWWKCKLCPARKVCHQGELPNRNCRTCEYAEPIKTGEWMCRKYEKAIPLEFQRKGCDHYTLHGDMASKDAGIQEIIHTFDAKILEIQEDPLEWSRKHGIEEF